jgi:hypothetical protein
MVCIVVEKLELPRKAFPELDALYFVTPKEENVDKSTYNNSSLILNEKYTIIALCSHCGLRAWEAQATVRECASVLHLTYYFRFLCLVYAFTLIFFFFLHHG